MNYRFTKDGGSPVYRYPKDTTTVIKELHPDGFEADSRATITDGSILAGIESKSDNGWHWDLSS